MEVRERESWKEINLLRNRLTGEKRERDRELAERKRNKSEENEREREKEIDRDRKRDTDKCIFIRNLGGDRTRGTNSPCIQD